MKCKNCEALERDNAQLLKYLVLASLLIIAMNIFMWVAI